MTPMWHHCNEMVEHDSSTVSISANSIPDHPDPGDNIVGSGRRAGRRDSHRLVTMPCSEDNDGQCAERSVGHEEPRRGLHFRLSHPERVGQDSDGDCGSEPPPRDPTPCILSSPSPDSHPVSHPDSLQFPFGCFFPDFKCS